ncbi:MAG: glycerate kinase [Myxococcaceae bacterium]|nr:glycerate kinase [Myxococcaceae bacterium]
MSMRVLVAPQQFKGTLTARQAAEAIARGVKAGLPDAELDLAPIADGGIGTVDALVLSQAGGEDRVAAVTGPLGKALLAHWGYLPGARDKPALGVVEMAAASGLTLVPAPERSVLDAHTVGTGELMRAALDAGCRRLLVGAGDSGTCDGGTGAAMALGARFLDAKGQPLPPGPRHLERLDRIDLTGLDPRLKGCALTVLADVVNPLLGETGTARVYGPQKGADTDEIDFLDETLLHFSLVVQRQLGLALHPEQGAGAAGGLAYGLAVLCGAKISRGFDVVSEALGLFQRVGEAEVVLTGEGQIDLQTAYAKGPWSLGRLARMQKKKVVAFAGVVSGGSGSATKDVFDDVIQVTPTGELPSAAEAERLLFEAARRWALSPRRRITVETEQK